MYSFWLIIFRFVIISKIVQHINLYRKYSIVAVISDPSETLPNRICRRKKSVVALVQQIAAWPIECFRPSRIEMFCDWRYVKGVMHWEMLNLNQSINTQPYFKHQHMLLSLTMNKLPNAKSSLTPRILPTCLQQNSSYSSQNRSSWRATILQLIRNWKVQVVTISIECLSDITCFFMTYPATGIRWSNITVIILMFDIWL